MRLVDHITRMPRPFDVERGQAAALAVPALTGALRDLVVGTAGCSPYLAGLIEKEANWLPEALEDIDAATAHSLVYPGVEPVDLKPALRQSKRRIALLTALTDLSGAWPLEKVTGALTRLADMACEAALSAAIKEQVRRSRLPDGEIGLFVLAMGKMGAFELNYSSDIDLICFFDETRHDPSDYANVRKGCVRAVQEMCKLLSDLTADGYVFRTDLRLRPDPSVTPVVLSTGAAERYYESLGRTWERAAYIKARPCAGDLAAGEAFLDELRPFVWRRHLDFAAVQDAHDMRLAIRAHKGTGGPITLPGHDMKLGRGGIREIEFFTQTRQLIAGGRDRDLRVRDTVTGLKRLAAKDWVSTATAEALTDHYRFARTVEHRVQMQRDTQTHKLPGSAEGFERLAAMMDMDRPALEAELKARLSSVHAETEGFFAPDARARRPGIALDDAMQARWRSYPALRSARGAALFDRIEPVLLERLSAATKPQEALAAFDGFLAGLPAGVQLFSLFEANPQLIDLLVDIVGTSPALAQYLSRNAGVLDAVIGGSFFDAWPGGATLTELAVARLAAEPDYEGKLDAIRAWAKEWHFRIGVHHLRQLTTATEAGKQYSDLARASIAALWPEVQAHFAKRHGPPPGRGGIILGMGSLGAGHLTPQSDLDLIVVYDPDGVDQSDGPRALPTGSYYARLTQAMITAVTTQTAQGRLYEADMRLRPSGNQGPVATSWPAFQRYQREDAWLWEHLALVRATVVAGPDKVAKDIELFRRSIIGRARDRSAVLAELAEMRARIAAAKQPASVWDAKIGPGRLQDIELLAQTGAVLTGEIKSGVREGLSACVVADILNAADAQHLEHTHGVLWRVQIASRLLSTHAVDLDTLGEGGQTVLLRAVDLETRAAAEDKLTSMTDHAAAIIDAATQSGKDGDAQG